jgi:hypothetical protein
MGQGKIIFYIFFSICLLLSLTMVVTPNVYNKINERYFKVVFKLMGYDIELKPSSPNKPEKITKIWGLCCTILFLLMLIIVSFTK